MREPGRTNMARGTILVVDEEPKIVDIVRGYLGRAGPCRPATRGGAWQRQRRAAPRRSGDRPRAPHGPARRPACEPDAERVRTATSAGRAAGPRLDAPATARPPAGSRLRRVRARG